MAQYPAAAKINLSLHVCGCRDDGYHLLETLVVFAEAGDKVVVNPADNISFDIKGPFSGSLGNEADNLVVKAAFILKKHAEAAGLSVSGAAISLNKNLPVASGLGGGSADAAATLLGLCELWNIDQTIIDVPGIAVQLGADVPMCLHSKPLVARGIGQQITPLHLPRLYLVLVNPGTIVATAEVFDNLDGRFGPALPELPENLSADALVQWLSTTENDLQIPAIAKAPVIGEVLAALGETVDCLFARMSGSGATCFGIYSTMESAKEAALDLDQRFPSWWCIASKTIAT